MSVVEQVIARAYGECGYVETPVNRTKYGRWYGMDGQPWCAMYVSWCFADHPEMIGGKFAYTPTFANWFKARGRFDMVPVRGDVVFFDFPDSVDRIQHVGIVLGVSATQITTIEGNTSSGTSGSQSNGGGVYVRTRPRDGSIAGYGHPAYVDPTPVEPPKEDDEMEGYVEVGGHSRGPDHPDFTKRDEDFIAAVKRVCEEYGKAAVVRSVTRYSYKDGRL